MGDSHPEDKVDQIGAPVNRVVLAGDADAHQDLVGPASRTHEYAQKKDADGDPIPSSRGTQGMEYGVIDFFIG
jgi:hypothetical protein